MSLPPAGIPVPATPQFRVPASRNRRSPQTGAGSALPSGAREPPPQKIRAKANPQPNDPYVANRRTYWENNRHLTRRVLIP
jgi:hypothetical protein